MEPGSWGSLYVYSYLKNNGLFGNKRVGYFFEYFKCVWPLFGQEATLGEFG
jgi:hypothetical protein